MPTPAPSRRSVPFPADAKIGFVNMQYVVAESKLGKAGQDQMQALDDKQTPNARPSNTEIQTLQQEIQAGASVLAPAVLHAEERASSIGSTREAQFQQQQHQVGPRRT